MYRLILKKIIIVLVFIFPLNSDSSSFFKPEYLNVPGGIFFHEIPVEKFKSGIFINNTRILTKQVNDKFYLIYGIPYGTPSGNQSINIVDRVSENTVNFFLKKRIFEKQYIKVSKKYSEPSSSDVKRIIKEQKILKSHRNTWSSVNPDINFIYPVEGIITGVFGTERYYNGKKGRYHNGIDIAAKMNDPIVAPSAGRVIVVGDFFYNGKFIYIDHGKGLLSIFIHLNEILVKKGESVKKGDEIGKIGTSGRSTGPHVHWSVMLNQTYIDPMIFINTNKNN
ncbi:MAG: M23 family metallopeptidase [Pseudomonadota bacterium]|nr:M23 family metallopeptidase [Pseudomonadota bacterium]